MRRFVGSLALTSALGLTVAVAVVPASSAAGESDGPPGGAPAKAAAVSDAGRGLPPPPADILDPDPALMGGASWSVSPTVIHPGETFSVRVRATSHSYFAVAPVSGGWLPSTQCRESGTGPVLSVCQHRAIASEYFRDPYWIPVTISFLAVPRPCDPTESCGTVARRFVAVVPSGRSVLWGTVVDREGHGVGGVTVVLRGAGSTWSVRTDQHGAYSALVPIGTYTVTPSGSWDPASRVVRLPSGGARADFRAAVAELDFDIEGSHLVAGLDWTTAAATGLVWRAGAVRAHTARGSPLAGSVVQLDAPYWDGAAPGSQPAPRIAVCDAGTARPLFAAGDRAERVTDGRGEVDFTVMFGSEPGTALFHARLKDDVTALDVERLGQTGATTGPSAPDITTPMQNAARLGLPAPPLFAISAASLQATLTEWWLGYRAGDDVGPQRMLPAGDFVPIRTRDNRSGALAFYPAGNPGPLRSHLAGGAALPSDYPTLVLAFRQVPIDPQGRLLQWQVRLDRLPTLTEWEAENGPATDGFLLSGAGLGNTGWLGGPLPPSVVDRAARVAYGRCVPGAAPPTTVVEIHSPVRLTTGEGSGAFTVAGGGSGPVTYVVPGTRQTLSLSGTGAGMASVVVRTDTAVAVYTFASRPGATGQLRLGTGGDASGLTFAGRPVTAAPGVRLRLSGLPKTLRAGRAVTVRVLVRDEFGLPAAGAVIAVRGPGVATTVLADGSGRARLGLRPRARGAVTVTATALSARPSRARIPVR